ncbi:hypothetical protein [Klebsiella phage phiKp_21]|uniref:Uncharacterized protein n=1 Tax=Klebsiella phage vB_KleM_RaK2 TaxID=1147094 RepID=H6X3S7_9CAUD|nr:hypothetical protein F403_gp415 [Klebsiella phage vB_KleM_RaK2]YP_010843037.1 hypothetical protein ACQ27_gp153 [Klebsiella phage K64-1]QOE32530.1 hypothetical protein CPT_Muenster_358 [Klebsiella phage Muenster]UYL05006.1 hypothetical protein DIDNDMLP_00015 [Klebsiella phage KP13-7]BEH88156.1 hypothetical protein [Klebsiella phage phiKp_21]AFA44393.1 hypothetical protein RaK2_00120 [Klebsiella phage vB_KleM_RaK2]
MNILTPENNAFDMDLVSDLIPEEMYCVLDLSPGGDSDFYFRHILNTITFNSNSADIQIGNKVLQVPLNWQIMLGDEDTGMVEMCTIENILNMKEPKAYVFNPIRSMYPRFEPVKVLRAFTLPTKWQIPIVPKKNLLCVPLQHGSNPPCVYFADENEKIQDLHLGL